MRNRYYRKYVEYLNREETDDEWVERLADEIDWLIDSVQELQKERDSWRQKFDELNRLT